MASNSELSLGELLEVHNSMDRKTRSEVIFQESTTLQGKNNPRANKNRPREQSSKIPPKPFPIGKIIKKKETNFRDPRFDSLCGSFNEKIFKETYSFVDEIKKNEKHELEKSLKEETDEVRKSQIKFLLKRFKDQEREENRKLVEENRKIEASEKIKKKLLEGKPAHFRTKSEKKMSDLVAKYEELKAKGKVQNFLKKKLKKNKKRDNREKLEWNN